MTVRRWLVAVGAIGVALLGLWAPAALAQSTDVGPSTDSFVVLTGRLEVQPGDTFNDAIIFDGDATIDGTVTGTVMAFNGDVVVSGTVFQDVVATNGRVTVKDGARVDGNVVSSKAPLIAPGTVGGEVRHQTFTLRRREPRDREPDRVLDRGLGLLVPDRPAADGRMAARERRDRGRGA